MNRFFKFVIFLCLILIFCGSVSCKNDDINNNGNTAGDDTTATIKFVDYDNKLISEVVVDIGDDAVAPNNPVRKGYKFLGWDASTRNIDKSKTIKALYQIEKNQLFIDYKEKDNKLIAVIGFYGDVEICGFEANIIYESTNLNLLSIDKVDVVGINEINFMLQSSENVKVYFYQNNIEDINEPFEFLSLTFDKTKKNYSISFDIQVEVAVNSLLDSVEFSKNNLTYSK